MDSIHTFKSSFYTLKPSYSVLIYIFIIWPRASIHQACEWYMVAHVNGTCANEDTYGNACTVHVCVWLPDMAGCEVAQTMVTVKTNIFIGLDHMCFWAEGVKVHIANFISNSCLRKNIYFSINRYFTNSYYLIRYHRTSWSHCYEVVAMKDSTRVEGGRYSLLSTPTL